MRVMQESMVRTPTKDRGKLRSTRSTGEVVWVDKTGVHHHPNHHHHRPPTLPRLLTTTTKVAPRRIDNMVVVVVVRRIAVWMTLWPCWFRWR